MLPTPLLAFCLSAGIFARCEVSEILYAVDVSKNLSFDPVSEDKGLTNKLIGFCVRDDRQTDVLVFDKNEAAAVRRTMIEDVNCKVDANEYGDAVHLRYAESCERASYPHVRGFILGYAAIQLFAKVCEVKAVTTIYKTVCDALFVDREVGKKHATVAKNEFPAWGDWRVKRTFNIDEDKITLHVYEDNEIARGAEGCAPASTAPALSLSPLRRHGLSFLVGQGGSGKTHRAILDTFSAGLKTLYLAPTNRLTREKGKEFPNLAVSTYHKYFKVSMKGEFNPTQMETAKRYQVLVMDETCYLSREFLEPLVAYCERAGVVVIACGDPGQLHPIDGAPPADWLRSRAGYYEEVLTDFRSRCDQLRALKSRMHMQDDATQLREMRAALPSVRVNEMFAQWRPGDLIIGATNRRNEVINNRIFRDYAKKHPTAPVPFVWAPTTFSKVVQMVAPPGGGELVEVVKGDIVEVPFKEGLKPADGWVLAYCLTVHKAQGLTLEGGRIWVLDDNLDKEFTRNAAYTVVSRAQAIAQLSLVA